MFCAVREMSELSDPTGITAGGVFVCLWPQLLLSADDFGVGAKCAAASSSCRTISLGRRSCFSRQSFRKANSSVYAGMLKSAIDLGPFLHICASAKLVEQFCVFISARIKRFL